MYACFDPLEVATRAALLLGAPAAAVLRDGRVVGSVGLDVDETAALQQWIDTDPASAIPWEGDLRRLARTRWPGDEADEVWILGDRVRRLPDGAYRVLAAFMEQVRADWSEMLVGEDTAA